MHQEIKTNAIAIAYLALARQRQIFYMHMHETLAGTFNSLNKVTVRSRASAKILLPLAPNPLPRPPPLLPQEQWDPLSLRAGPGARE